MPYIEAAASIIPVRVKDSKAKANDASAISRQAGRSPRYPPSPLSPSAPQCPSVPPPLELAFVPPLLDRRSLMMIHWRDTLQCLKSLISPITFETHLYCRARDPRSQFETQHSYSRHLGRIFPSRSQ